MIDASMYQERHGFGSWRQLGVGVSYRLLALDLDGTLLTDQKRISPRTRWALNTAAAGGCLIAVATGRGFRVARYYCDGLALNGPQITYNGAVIYDPVQDAELARYLVPRDDVAPAVDFFLHAGVPLAYFSTDGLYLDQRMLDAALWLPGNTGTPFLVSDWTAVLEKPCIKLAGHASPVTIAALRPRAVEEMGHRLYVTQTASTLLEMLHPEVSKGAALRRIAHMLDVPREQIIAFGDNHNDLDMLEFAGVGVAMGNASAEAKAVADLVTGSNLQDGIAQALLHLGVVAE